MALSPLRKKLNIAFGMVLLSVIGIVLWPLVSRPIELRTFCDELHPGISLDAIRRLAADHRFKVSPEANGVAFIYDFQSLGKFSCSLSIQNGTLASASFVVGD